MEVRQTNQIIFVKYNIISIIYIYYIYKAKMKKQKNSLYIRSKIIYKEMVK